MKKQNILAIALAVALAVGAAFTVGGTQVYADDINRPVATCTAADEICDFNEGIEDYTKELVKEGIISQAEATRLIENDKKIEQLFNEYDQLTEENDAQLDQKLDQIEKEVADIYEKIDNAYLSGYYKELVDNNVLNENEIKQLKAVEQEMNKLFNSATSEQNFANLEAKQAALYEANKALYDKVDAYFATQMQQEIDQMYQELIDSGELTADHVEQLKAIDRQAEKLIEQAGDDLTDEEWEQLDQKIDELYETIEF